MTESFADYVKHGWVICAIPPGTKGPRTKGWQKRENGITNQAQAIGLAGAGLCHAWSGTCALDVDQLELTVEFLQQRGIDLLAMLNAADAVQIYSGKEGRAKLLYRLPEPLSSKQLAPYKAKSLKTGKDETYHAFELRCANSEGDSVQDCLPGTIHPELGHPYRWVYGNRLMGHWSTLPMIPEALHALWLEALDGSTERTTVGPQAPLGAAANEILKLLSSQDPSDYHEWVKVGFRIHHETQGSAEGLEIYDRWSQGSSKYAGRADVEAKWRSMRSDAANALTLGSLRAEAVSKAEDFSLIEMPAKDEDDTRVDPMMQRLVGQHLIYVKTLDRYFDARTRDVFPSDRAVRNAFLPDIPYVLSGDKPKKPDPVMWLMGSMERRGRDVSAVGMHPGEGITFEDGGKRYANGYRPRIAVEALAPTPFEVECFQFIWARMLDTHFQQWLMKFYAYALKHPGVKIQTAPLLVSDTTGSGKSTITNAIPRLLFGEVLEYGEPQLKSPFNGELLNAWWVSFEEVCAGNTKSERRYVTDKIKPWITNPYIPLTIKGLQAITIPNRLQFTASSNHPDALQLDDVDERRWGVCAVKEAKYSQREKIDVYQGFLNTPRAAGVLKHIFERVNLTGFYPTAEAPVTNAKRVMVEMGRGEWESRIQERWEAKEAPFDRDIFTVRELRMQLFGQGGPNPVMLGQMLGKAPFHFKQLPNCGSKRMYAQRNFDQWSKLSMTYRLEHIQSGKRPVYVDWDAELPEEFACPLL